MINKIWHVIFMSTLFVLVMFSMPFMAKAETGSLIKGESYVMKSSNQLIYKACGTTGWNGDACQTTNTTTPGAFDNIVYLFHTGVSLNSNTSYTFTFKVFFNSVPSVVVWNSYSFSYYVGSTPYTIPNAEIVYSDTTVTGSSIHRDIQITFKTTISNNPDYFRFQAYNNSITTSSSSNFGLFRQFNYTSQYITPPTDMTETNKKLDSLNDKTNTIINQNDETNKHLDDMNKNLTDSDTSESTSGAGDFFSGFDTNTFGLTSIITAPLALIGSITSSSCSSVGLPLPYVNKTLNLPCMTSIYQSALGSIFSLYQTITFGIVAYWVCVRIFNLVKDFKNPDHDEVEVFDL